MISLPTAPPRAEEIRATLTDQWESSGDVARRSKDLTIAAAGRILNYLAGGGAAEVRFTYQARGCRNKSLYRRKA